MSAPLCLFQSCGNKTNDPTGYCHLHDSQHGPTAGSLTGLAIPPPSEIGPDEYDTSWYSEWEEQDWSEESAYEFHSRGIGLADAERWYDMFTVRAYRAKSPTWLIEPEEAAEYAKLWNEKVGTRPDSRWFWIRRSPSMFQLGEKSTQAQITRYTKLSSIPARWEPGPGEETWKRLFNTHEEDIDAYIKASTASKFLVTSSYAKTTGYSSYIETAISSAVHGRFLDKEESIDGKGPQIIDQSIFLYSKGFFHSDLKTVVSVPWPNSVQDLIEVIQDRPKLDHRILNLIHQDDYDGFSLDKFRKSADIMESSYDHLAMLGYHPKKDMNESSRYYARMTHMSVVPSIIRTGRRLGVEDGYEEFIQRVHDSLPDQDTYSMIKALDSAYSLLGHAYTPEYADAIISGTGDPIRDKRIMLAIVTPPSSVGSTYNRAAEMTDAVSIAAADCSDDEWTDLVRAADGYTTRAFSALTECDYDAEAAKTLVSLMY